MHAHTHTTCTHITHTHYTHTHIHTHTHTTHTYTHRHAHTHTHTTHTQTCTHTHTLHTRTHTDIHTHRHTHTLHTQRDMHTLDEVKYDTYIQCMRHTTNALSASLHTSVMTCVNPYHCPNTIWKSLLIDYHNIESDVTKLIQSNFYKIHFEPTSFRKHIFCFWL